MSAQEAADAVAKRATAGGDAPSLQICSTSSASCAAEAYRSSGSLRNAFETISSRGPPSSRRGITRSALGAVVLTCAVSVAASGRGALLGFAGSCSQMARASSSGERVFKR